MITKDLSKKVFVEIVVYLYIALFAYAAVSKLSDFENFKIQISQSILLTAFAKVVSYTVIITEIVIAILLIIERTRLIALYAGYSLMILFTVYIFIMLNYSPHIPCSCGGVLENLSWQQHMIFNLAFVILAFFAILFSNQQNNKTSVRIYTLLIIATSSIGCMIVLFLTSDNIVRKRNDFTRTIIPFGIKELAKLNLHVNSYYFAGSGKNKIYLGNITSPATMTIVDANLQKMTTEYIHLSDSSLSFSAIRIKVVPPNFYVFDGTIPGIFVGNTKSWKANLQLKGVQTFDLAEAIDSNNIVFRAPTKKYGNMLGTFNLKEKGQVSFNSALLQKQFDGFFDTDGILLYNQQLKKIIYTYYYRNQYVVADKNLKLMHRGNTIDTTTTANLKVVTQQKNKQKTLGAPAEIVNRLCATNNNLLFINSMLPGKSEPLEIWDHASIIDIYDYTKKEYLVSIYLYNLNGQKMKSFIVTDNYLYALFENDLIAYTFSEELKKIILK